MPEEAFAIEYTPSEGPRRRIRYEPDPDGTGWQRYEEHWEPQGWYTEGVETVCDLRVGNPKETA